MALNLFYVYNGEICNVYEYIFVFFSLKKKKIITKILLSISVHIIITSCKRSVAHRVRMLLNASKSSYIKICHHTCFLSIKLVERK